MRHVKCLEGWKNCGDQRVDCRLFERQAIDLAFLEDSCLRTDPAKLVPISAVVQPQAVLPTLESTFKQFNPGYPFDYEFVDEAFGEKFAHEQLVLKVTNIFAGMAIFISCLGLFGLASFMADRRTKEIGIRKTNGASTSNILRLLSLDFTKWVLLANIIAWPLIWLAMQRWLEDFAYRVDIPLWIFPVAGILAFIIAIATVSYHAVKASRQNPSMSLRYE